MGKRPTVITAQVLSNLLVGAVVSIWVPVERRQLTSVCPPGPTLATCAVLAAIALLAIAHFVAAVGLFRMRRWGWRVQIAVMLADVLLLPLAWSMFAAWIPGAIVWLLYLRRPVVRSLFNGRSVAPDPNALRLPWFSRVVVGLSLCTFVVVPSLAFWFDVLEQVGLLDTYYSNNVAAALGDVRTVMSAEAAYTTVNGGCYDSLACLGDPQGCISSYPACAPTFVDSAIASGRVKQGYLRTFTPGASACGGGLSKSSTRTFAYVVAPSVPGKTGTCSFCGDSTGVICYRADGRPPSAAGGLCDLRDCTPWRERLVCEGESK
jgi:hypothetical protein